MNNYTSDPAEEAFAKLFSASQPTVCTSGVATGDVFDRVRWFVEMYAQVATKPRGAALVYQAASSPATHCRELDRPLVVGRLQKSDQHPDGADVAVEDAQISRRHFCIDVTDGFHILRDLDSRNGSYLNNDPAPLAETILKAGDVIRAGNSVFVFTGQPAAGSA